MSKFDDLILDHVRAMPNYVPGRSPRQAEAETGVRCIKMASNENPFGPSPLAVEAMRVAATQVNWYPGCRQLRFTRGACRSAMESIPPIFL